MLKFLPLTSVPAEDEALRQPVREFIHNYLQDTPPHVRARSWMGFDAEFSRELGRRGWLGATLPKAYGGQELGAFARFVLAEELLAAGAPVSAHWIADRQSGPLIQKYGTEAQKQFYLPKICRGEAFFCIGMSEPNSGSDLASVATRATPNEQGWLLNGQKIWTTNAHHSHFMIALVRTSGAAGDRHQGLSQVIVDLSLPGLDVRPIKDLTGDAHFCEVFFDNVQLSHDALIGTEGDGWNQVTAELAFERSGPERIYSSIVLLEEWLAYLRDKGGVNEQSLIVLGSILSRMTVLRAMAVSVTGLLQAGESPVVEAALVKDLGTELEQQLPLLVGDALQTMADDGEVIPPALMKVIAYITHISPSFSLRGGTREILRGMIARGLGLR